MTTYRSASRLERVNTTLHGQRFEHEEGDDPGRVVEIPQHLWDEFGRPETITVVVYPGDALNDNTVL